MNDGVNFTLTDCSSDKTGKIEKSANYSAFKIDNGGTFNMYGGIIDGNRKDACAVYVSTSGTFKMYGGSITQNLGDGVDNHGTFDMNGGSITDNSGGGVDNGSGATFNMNGGSITQNKKRGMFNEGTFTMCSGEIAGNIVGGNGGGVYNRGTFTMNGGSIIENVARPYSGQVGCAGVYNEGTFTISGNAIIKDNKNEISQTLNNVYLCEDKKIVIGTSGLISGASIGVTVQTPPTGSNSVDISIATPTPKDALEGSAAVTGTGVATTNSAITWMKGNEAIREIARYNTVYTASVTLSPDTGYEFGSAVTANIKSADGSTVGSGTVTDNGDGTITVSYTFAATRKANVKNISNPRDITGVTNGTQKTAQDIGLPETVTIGTEDENRAANVTWDLENLAEGTYEPSVLTEQSFKVNGTVILPDDITNGNNLELKVTVQVTVSAAGVVGVPQATPAEGTYTSNQSVVLSSSTEGAEIYYTTDGSEPSRSNGTKYTIPVPVEGVTGQEKVITIKAIAVKSGMQDSNVVAFTYTIQIPAQKYTVTVTEGSGSGEYAQGEIVAITANTAPSGQQFKNWTVESGNITLANGTNATTTFTMPAEAVSVKANYEVIPATQYTITASAGANGSISPGGDVTVAEGGSQTFTISPSLGYEIDTLKVDHADVAVSASYTFSNVNANHTIEVTFKQKSQLPVEPDTTYQIINGADSTLTAGGSEDLTIRGNGEFSKFTGVKVDGSLIDQSNYTAKEGSTIIALKASYLNTLAAGPHTVEILWTDGSASTTFTIDANASDNGGNNQNDNDSSNNNSDNNNSDNNNSGNSNSNSTPSDDSALSSNIDKKADVPKTGDSTPIAGLFILVGLLGTGLILTGKKDKMNLKRLRK